MATSNPDYLQQGAALLRKLPYFAALDDANLERVARLAQRREFPAQHTILLEGEISSSLYLVQSGYLKAIKLSGDGREHVLYVVEAGDVVNTIGVFADSPHPGTVITLEPVTLWIISREVMLTLVEEQPILARAIIQELAGRVQYLIGLVEDLSLRSVENRLAKMLLEQANDEGIVPRRRWATQAEIASRLGTVPDVLNRTLRAFAEENLVVVSRHEIRIIDRDGLQAKADLT